MTHKELSCPQCGSGSVSTYEHAATCRDCGHVWTLVSAPWNTSGGSIRDDIDAMRAKAMVLTGLDMSTIHMMAPMATEVYADNHLKAGDKTVRLCIHGDTKSMQAFLAAYNDKLGDGPGEPCEAQIGERPDAPEEDDEDEDECLTTPDIAGDPSPANYANAVIAERSMGRTFTCSYCRKDFPSVEAWTTDGADRCCKTCYCRQTGKSVPAATDVREYNVAKPMDATPIHFRVKDGAACGAAVQRILTTSVVGGVTCVPCLYAAEKANDDLAGLSRKAAELRAALDRGEGVNFSLPADVVNSLPPGMAERMNIVAADGSDQPAIVEQVGRPECWCGMDSPDYDGLRMDIVCPKHDD